MALFSTFFWISRYFAIFWHIRCQILFMLVILPGFKCGEIQAKYKKCNFQLVKVTTSESPKHRVTLAKTVKRPQWCTEKLQMTPKHFTGVNHINRKYFGPFWDLLLTHGSLKVTFTPYKKLFFWEKRSRALQGSLVMPKAPQNGWEIRKIHQDMEKR